jgi:hypothetical protein
VTLVNLEGGQAFKEERSGKCGFGFLR